MGKSARKMANKEYGTEIEILRIYFIDILRTRIVFLIYLLPITVTFYF